MVSGEASFLKLCSLAPDPDEREWAVRMAWKEGYERFPEEKIGRTPTTLLLGLAGLFSIIWGVVFLLVGMSSSGGFSPATVGIFFLIVGSVCFKIKGSKERQPWPENVSINKKRHQLQIAGAAFLRDSYENWVKKGREEFDAAMKGLVGGDQILCGETVLAAVPEQDTQPTKTENLVSPNVSKPKRLHIWGYLVTPKKLVVVPHFAAETRSSSIINSAITSWAEEITRTSKDYPVLDLYETALQTVRLKSETANPSVLKSDRLSLAEFFFAEMVSLSYSGNQDTMGKLTIATRDGRTLIVSANQDTASAIRDAMDRARR